MHHSPLCSGVWLDHRAAKIVHLHGDDVREQEILSSVERHTHATGGTKLGGTPYFGAMGASEQRQNERRAHGVAAFYQKIMEAISEADGIALLGPGRARGEFARFLRKHEKLAGRIVSVVASGALTDRQLVAEVKATFHKSSPRRSPLKATNARGSEPANQI